MAKVAYSSAAGLQDIADYVQYDRYALVNRETGFVLILMICNSTIGYPGGFDRSYWLRTPELAIQRCRRCHLHLHQAWQCIPVSTAAEIMQHPHGCFAEMGMRSVLGSLLFACWLIKHPEAPGQALCSCVLDVLSVNVKPPACAASRDAVNALHEDGVCACRVSTPQCGGPDWEQCAQSVAVMDVKWYSQFNSLLSMLRTIFICAVLAAGVFVFNRDASRLVLEPIERMLKKVKDVSENPLAIKQVHLGGLCCMSA